MLERRVNITKQPAFKEPTPKTVSIVPTWEGVIPLLVEAAANGSTAEARKEAMGELLRLARTVDQMNAELRAAKEPHR